VIFTGAPGGADHGALRSWERRRDIPAVAHGRLVVLDADAMDRSAPRILDAAEAMCAAVDQARADPDSP
jgi:ABC-type Fe3+-hydroxamate transport system substrate-binding protein